MDDAFYDEDEEVCAFEAMFAPSEATESAKRQRRNTPSPDSFNDHSMDWTPQPVVAKLDRSTEQGYGSR